jgi:hypothetical protein
MQIKDLTECLRKLEAELSDVITRLVNVVKEDALPMQRW